MQSAAQTAGNEEGNKALATKELICGVGALAGLLFLALLAMVGAYAQGDVMLISGLQSLFGGYAGGLFFLVEGMLDHQERQAIIKVATRGDLHYTVWRCIQAMVSAFVISELFYSGHSEWQQASFGVLCGCSTRVLLLAVKRLERLFS